jgi:hypothetical protein
MPSNNNYQKKFTMKQHFKTLLAGAVLSLLSFASFSQDEKPSIPRYVSDKGYWVVESNIHTPLDQIIWFYNNDNILMYKEVLNGVKLNPDKRKVKMKLKKVLEASALAWEQKKVPEENKQYVAAILK